jgi:hypothetical protein
MLRYSRSICCSTQHHSGALQNPANSPTRGPSTTVSFVDSLPDDILAKTCPMQYGIGQEFSTPAAKKMVGQALDLWLTGPKGQATVSGLVERMSPALLPVWVGLTLNKKLLTLKTLNESRALYLNMQLNRSIEWKDPSGRVTVVNQKCSMAPNCASTSFIAEEMCRLFNGVNASIAPSITYEDGRGAILWSTYLDTIVKTQWENGGELVGAGNT